MKRSAPVAVRRRAPSRTPSPDGAGPTAVAAALKRRLRARQRTYASWISIGHPEIASLFASAKGHFVGIDLEHTTTELSAAQAMIRACHEYGRACLPRMAPGRYDQLRRLLDAGADGIIVPQVAGRADVERVASMMRYPPEGTRSYGIAPAHRYGRAFEAYVASANASLSLIVQVESVEAISRIEEIASHPAVDGVMVGPYDLSGSMGIPGALTHPRVLKACEAVVAACQKTSVGCGIHVTRPTTEEMRRRFDDGFTFLVLGSDVFNLWYRGVEFDGMIEACGEA